MKNCIVSIDLGSTNFKFTLFDDSFTEILSLYEAVEYVESGKKVEFDIERYISQLLSGISNLISKSRIDTHSVRLIALTGQAESFVLTDINKNPICNAISWRDDRSEDECLEIQKVFSDDLWFSITGLPHISTTWPVTKLLWFRKNNADLFSKIGFVFLLKDYVIYRLSGKYVSEYTVFSFSGLLDLKKKIIWPEMLDFLGMKRCQFPELVEPGSIVGELLHEVSAILNLPEPIMISSGVLDHVGGMVGTGNLENGKASVSTGTVQALALRSDSFIHDDRKIECHYGGEPDSFIQLLVLESGGVCLQWFRDNFLPLMEFSKIDEAIPNKTQVVFLPYVCGLNPPEYDSNAKGVFYGFDVHNKVMDFACAVMESIGFLLRKNLEFIEKDFINISEILFIGGAAKSSKFSQIISNIIGKPVVSFKNSEPPSLGAAIIAAVNAGWYPNIEACAADAVKIDKVFTPAFSEYYQHKYKVFLNLYSKLFDYQGEENGD